MEKTLPELYLEKIELLSQREREVLIESIDLFNKPVFMVSGSESNPIVKL